MHKCTGCELCLLACSELNEKEFNPGLARLRVMSKYTKKGLLVSGKLCNLCLKCLEVCHNNAIRMEKGRLAYDAEVCTSCGLCVDVCPREVIVKKVEEVGICMYCPPLSRHGIENQVILLSV